MKTLMNTKNARIVKEIHEIITHFKDMFEVYKYNSNPYKYTFHFIGPEGCPYEYIPISVDIVYPIDYPFNPPIIKFRPPLYHPNINSDGVLVIETLNGTDWSPAQTTKSILLNILTLLHEPYLCTENLPQNDKGKEEANDIVNEHCVNMEALNLWRSDPGHFKLVLTLIANDAAELEQEI